MLSPNAGRYRICVIGLGKIGLALAAHYAAQGAAVAGADVDHALVELINRGEVPTGSEVGLAERVRAGVGAGLLRASSNTCQAVARSNVVIVIVPLLVDAEGRPAFEALDTATTALARGLRAGTLVIYETTLPVGTTRERFSPMLERSGLRAGMDFHLAFSPERVYVGRTFEDLQRYPKVVGGTTPDSTRLAAEFYQTLLDAPVMCMSDADTAEFVKLAETTYRDVNIGLANELARFAQRRGIDALTAFHAANSQPFSLIHQPGVGVGGHCIPVYPRFLLSQAQSNELGIVREARRVNDDMAGYAIALLGQQLGGLANKRVLILGLAYRPGVKEASCSSAYGLIAALEARNAQSLLHDPLFSDAEILATGATPVSLAEPLAVDAVVLQADHAEYRDLNWSMFQGCRAVLDGRNALDSHAVTAAGLTYLGIGTGARTTDGILHA